MKQAHFLSRIKNSLSPDWNLDTVEINARQSQYGFNDIIENPGNRWLELVIDTAKDPMIWFLIVTSLLFAILKNYNQSLILFLATIPLIGMDAFLHWRTQASTQTLSNRLATTATVIRNNTTTTIPARELVPGDLVIVPTGMPFPADGILVESHSVQVDESSLTGESFPIKKESTNSLSEHNSLPPIDNQYWGFAGTRILTGDALQRIVYTGKETLYGEIVTSAIQSRHTRTPIQTAISKLVLSLIIAASVLCIILALVRLSQGFGLVDALLSAATLAVAALPDEFPVVFTFFLGIGVYRLAQKKALVKRAVSVENIGRVTVICSDKTGTITEGYLRLNQYEPAKPMNQQSLLYLAGIASRIDSQDLLDLAIFEKIEHEKIIIPERITTFPFTETRKRESSIVHYNDDKWLIAMKGAPEEIMSKTLLTQEEKIKWQKRMDELACSGQKLIACAQLIIDKTTELVEPETGYQFAGLLAFSDNPRKEVYEAIRLCQEGKIHVLMITGDHPETARSIAKDIGLGNGNPIVILGKEVTTSIQEKGVDCFREIDVIARAMPSQKLDIVKHLQSLNEIVAVTGDGVNDVPALKAGDVSIAMGNRGTQAAREVSDIILLDDNFDSIVNAIAEGRQLFKNMKMSFKYLLLIHMPFVLSAAIIPLMGYPMLYYPIHIVMIELIIHPTAMLVFQNLPKSNRLDRMDPTRRRIQFFSNKEWGSILGIGFLATGIVLFSYMSYVTPDPNHARALVLAEISFTSAAITLGLSGFHSITSWLICISTLIFGVILIQTPFLAKFLSFTPLHFYDWSLILLSALLILLLTQFTSRYNL